MSDKIILRYDLKKEYDNTATIDVGATDSTTLRSVTTYNDANCKHVRKFGTDYAIGDVTNGVLGAVRSAAGNSLFYDIQGWNGTA